MILHAYIDLLAVDTDLLAVDKQVLPLYLQNY